MNSLIVVHPDFDVVWPLAADHFRRLWESEGPVQFVRLTPDERRPLGAVVQELESVERLVALSVPVTPDCARRMTALREAVIQEPYGHSASAEVKETLRGRGILLYHHTNEEFWSESVAETALALTLGALRRIPQLCREMITSHDPWDYNPPGGRGTPGGRGHQYGDDPRFTAGTLRGKRVRLAGIGNIGSRFAGFASAIGANVAAWDPVASDPCFHQSGARKVWRLDTLVRDAEIFAPMMPLVDATRGIVTREHIMALPKGCLVVLVTRAGICDMPAIRERVLADEISLAADVFDVEPLPFNDPLLGRHNVIHTPHLAGRTQQANERWAEKLAEQFSPR